MAWASSPGCHMPANKVIVASNTYKYVLNTPSKCLHMIWGQCCSCILCKHSLSQCSCHMNTMHDSYISNCSILMPYKFWTECLTSYMSGPPSPYDADLLEVIRQKYLVRPPRRPVTGPFDINEPVWARLVDWNLMQQKLLQIWEGEVGLKEGLPSLWP